LYRWAKVFLLLGIVAGALNLIHNAHVRFDPGADRHDGRVVHVRIGGRDFAVPGEYIRGPVPRGDAKQLYLWLTLPNYEPYQGDYVEGKNPVPIGYRHLIVLIDDTAFTTDLNFRFHAYRDSTYLIPREADGLYGLKRTEIYRQVPRDVKPYLWADLYSVP